MQVIPYLQFRSTSLYQYNLVERDFTKGRPIQALLTQNLIAAETYTGLLTVGAKKRLTKAIEFLVQSTPGRRIYNPYTQTTIPNFKLSFITLTFADETVINSKDAHKACLEPFLQWLRRSAGVKSYIWKAEFQKRGTLHYHITCDAFVDCKELRLKWNYLQRKAGYMNQYIEDTGDYEPPGTEVKKVWKERNLCDYLIKEFTKCYQNDKSVDGKLWDCSKNLKGRAYYSGIYDNYYSDAIQELIKAGEVKAVTTEHCSIFKFKTKKAASIMTRQDRLLYSRYMASIRETEVIRQKIDKKFVPPPKEKHSVTFAVKNKYKTYHNRIIAEIETRLFSGGLMHERDNLFDSVYINQAEHHKKVAFEIDKSMFSTS